MAANLDIVIKATNNASGTIKTIGSDLRGLETTATKSVTDFGDKVNDVAKKIGVVFAAAAAGAGLAFAKFTADGIGKAADLEAQIDGIAAVMGKTKDEVAPLNKLIKDLGIDPNLKVSTFEAADAVQMLARNGLDMTEILDGAARSTVLLANATDADFGTAADIATDVMSIFNIEAKNMNRAVNGITSVVNNSKFSIDDYALALAQGGGVAGAVGVEFDDFNTTIAAIAPNFGSGSDAGTSFKTFLQRLVPDTNPAAEAMKRLGLFTGLTRDEFEKAQAKIIGYQRDLAALDPTSKNSAKKAEELTEKIQVLQGSLELGQNAFFDATGTMKGMDEIAGLLQRALSGLSQEQKNSALNTIFGTDSMRAAVGLAKVGQDEFLALKNVMGNTSAEESAATRNNNLAGSLEILRDTIESVQLSIGDKFKPTLRALAQQLTALVTDNQTKIEDFFGRLAEWFAVKIPEAMDYAVNTAFPAIYDAFQYLYNEVLPKLQSAVQFVTEHWGFFSGAIKALAVVFAAASLVSTIAGIVGAITTITGVIGGMITIITGGSGVVAAIAGGGGMVASLGMLLNPVGLAVAAVAGLALAWKTDFGGIRTETSTKAALIAETVNNLGRSVATSLSNSMYIAQSGWNAAWGNLVGTISSKAADMRDRAASAGRDVSSSLTGGVQNGASAFRSTLSTMADYVRGVFTEKKNDWLTAGRDVAYGIRDGVSNQASGLYNQLRSMGTSMLSSFKNALGIRSPSTEFMEAGYNIALGLAVGIDSGGNLVDAALSDIQAKTEYALRKQAEYMDAWMRDTINANAAAVQQTKSLQQQVFALSQAQYAVYSQAMAAGNSQAAALAAAQQAATGGGGASTGGSGPNSGTGAASAPAQFYTPETLPAQYQSLQQEIYEKIYGFLSGIGMSRFDVQGQITTESVQGAVAHIKEKVLDALRGVTDVLTGGLSVNDIVSKVPQLQEAIKWLTSVDVHGQTGSSLQAAVSLDLRQKLMGFSDEIGKIFQDASTQLNAITKASQIGSLLSNPGGAINSLKTLVSNTFGNVSISDITDQFSDVSNRIYGRVSGAVGYGQDLAGLTTDKVRDAVKNLLSAGTDSNVGDIKEAIDTLLQFRNLTSEQRKIDSHGVFDDFGTTTQTGNTFNVTFNGVSGNQQGILADIQFLNSLYGATP